MQRSQSNVLNTKLMPPRLHSALVQRGDLWTRLDAGLTRKLTVVTAPTGFGKTTLVSQWITSRDFSSAWVTLDANDNDPSRFWTYVVSALRTFDSTLGKTTLAALTTSQPPSFQSLLTPLINDLTRLTEPCVLALDDYHVITSPEINDGFSFLIQHLPESLHIVLTARHDPNLPLAILRVRDELAEINAAHLRFNQQETETFLRESLQADFSSTAATQLFQKTEGWAAGLRLAVLSLQNKGIGNIEKLIESFSGSDRYVADYLTREVVESLPEDAQLFLLKTCFLSRLTGSLCDSTAGATNSAVRLEQLERENLFLVQLEHGGGRVWYRYHPLFAESIQYLAKQRLDESAIKNIFEKASAWYEYHGLYDEAIETALAAKSFDRAMTLIEKFIEIHNISELLTLGRWLENIPSQEIFLHPVICFAYSQVLLYSSPERFAPATAARLEPFLHAAETAWRAEKNHHRLGQLLSTRGMAAWWQGDFQKAFEYARQALALIPEHDVLYRGSSLLIVSREALDAGRILEAQDTLLEARAQMGAAQNIHGVLAAMQMLSEISFWQGELEQAAQLNQQVMDEAIGGDEMLDDKGIASLGLARVAYEQNELEHAEQLAAQALGFAQQHANESLQVETTILLACIHAAKNNFARAGDLLKSLVNKIQNPIYLRQIQEAQARLSILSGDLLSLKSWSTLVSSEKQNSAVLQKERESLTLARLLIAENKSHEALAALKGWNTNAAENGRVRSQVEVSCLEALAHHADSNLTQAAQSLTEALTLGHAKGFRRVFLDEGTRMSALLQATLPTLPNRTLSLFAKTLLHSFVPETNAPRAAANSKVQIEALSQQEIRVLRLLVAGMSNPDIARELVVSVNTIKTQVKSIYRKLDVTSRDEAGEMARELKLL
ncbi:MAG: hypothetical protein HZB19_02010 [Chloroflexi bacterium]|nr:hypothetical protein [Chloroflexota bacterium]